MWENYVSNKYYYSMSMLLMMSLAACGVDFGLLAGKQCDSDLQCAQDYSCDVVSGMCMPSEGSICSSEGSEIICGVSIGECTQGIQVCKDGHWSACSGRPAKNEICNELDDDCDGDTDETFGYKGQQCEIEEGNCVKIGTWVCNQWYTDVTCQVPSEGSPEICDGNDNDCDGIVDNLDADSDGYYGCDDVAKHDCNDNDPTIYDGAPEQCNAIDDDCDGDTDEDWPLLGQDCVMGIGGCADTGVWQCNSAHDDMKCSAQSGTGFDELCNNIDDNCDGETDEDFPGLGMVCYAGIGICRQSGNFVCSLDGLSLTCNASPGQPEDEADFTCDGLDHNCDGLNNNGIDLDGDGYEKCTGAINGVYDCNDEPSVGNLIYPGQSDSVGDGEDNNCDGVDGVDADADGHASLSSGGDDCDDEKDDVYPGALDTVGSVSSYGTITDENCDGLDGVDADGDGYASTASLGSDCNDDPFNSGLSFNPSITETCNGEDNNCSGGSNGGEWDVASIYLGTNSHCTACNDNCGDFTPSNVSGVSCFGVSSGCDFTSCTGLYFDVDGNKSNGCEILDDSKNGSQYATSSTAVRIYNNSGENFGNWNEAGEEFYENCTGRLPSDNRSHVSAQNNASDYYYMYFEDEGQNDNINMRITFSTTSNTTFRVEIGGPYVDYTSSPSYSSWYRDMNISSITNFQYNWDDHAPIPWSGYWYFIRIRRISGSHYNGGYFLKLIDLDNYSAGWGYQYCN